MTAKSTISARELNKLLKDKHALILDCRFDLTDVDYGQRSWQQGHIPGAMYVDLERALSAPVTEATGRHPLPQPADFKQSLKQWGLRPDSRVIAYDDGAGMFAARLWWLLRWLGHTNVRVLDGGWAAWQAAGLDVSTEADFTTDPAADYIDSLQPDNSLLIDADTLMDKLQVNMPPLWDARDPQRFAGAVEPIDKKAGHIPGAENVFFMQNLDNGHFLPADQLKQRFDQLLAGRSAQSVIHMCGSGVTACQNQLAMAIAGLPTGKLYAGSWSEWIIDPARPTEPRSE